MKHISIRLAALSLLASSAVLAAADGSVGGVRWAVPARWQATKERPMRVATYAIPAAPGQEAGECAVFFFGQGQGGSVEENFSRWAGQFEGASTPRKSATTINGLKVHQIDLTGTYLSPGGPMMQSQGKKPGWRLLGAIVEAPEGLVFFKCTGPTATIAKAEKEFAELLKSVTKAAKA
jgi:hypothetical protein